MLVPQVVGFRLRGRLREGATATDLVLTVTQILRETGVVGKFVEYFGEGLVGLPLADRATIGNMSPEYGATCGFFPVDEETLKYLEMTGRAARADRARRGVLPREPALARPAAPADVHAGGRARPGRRRAQRRRAPAAAGPRAADGGEGVVPRRAVHVRRRVRQQHGGQGRRGHVSRERSGGVPDAGAARGRRRARRGAGRASPRPSPLSVEVELDGERFELSHGAVVIAAITSCTNTSNPQVMVGAGLLARKAVERGLRRAPWVKSSLAPGSKVVTEYYERAGLTPYLEELGFHTVGYGCTTCIGNSGPLPEPISEAVTEGDLAVCSVLSGNRNFEARIHPEVKANYLASPPLVVAYALAGRMDLDLTSEPLGLDGDGNDVLPARHLAELAGDRRHDRRGDPQRHVPRGRTRTCSPATTSGASCRCRRASCSPGTRTRRTCGCRRTSRACRPSRSRSRTSTAPAAWSRSATPSRPTTSRPRGRSSPTRRRGATSSSTASSAGTSTRTAHAAATTR